MCSGNVTAAFPGLFLRLRHLQMQILSRNVSVNLQLGSIFKAKLSHEPAKLKMPFLKLLLSPPHHWGFFTSQFSDSIELWQYNRVRLEKLSYPITKISHVNSYFNLEV